MRFPTLLAVAVAALFFSQAARAANEAPVPGDSVPMTGVVYVSTAAPPAAGDCQAGVCRVPAASGPAALPPAKIGRDNGPGPIRRLLGRAVRSGPIRARLSGGGCG